MKRNALGKGLSALLPDPEPQAPAPSSQNIVPLEAPIGALEPNGLVCRAASGACDLAETCSGSSAACPADAFQPPSFDDTTDRKRIWVPLKRNDEGRMMNAESKKENSLHSSFIIHHSAFSILVAAFVTSPHPLLRR